MMNQSRHEVRFTDEDISRARAFADAAVPYNYDRGGVGMSESVRRLLVGKLGEIAFARFLHQHNKRIVGNEEMFNVWADVYAADWTDFLTGENQTIDIKTASKNFHRRITIPEDQFLYRPSDYYVGVRIAEDLRSAVVIGYASHADVQRRGVRRGPNEAMNYDYASYDMDLTLLLPIQPLLDLIDDE